MTMDCTGRHAVWRQATTEAARRLRGVLLMLAAVGVFAIMDAVMKQLTGHYPPVQVACLRGVSSLPFVALPYLLTGHLDLLRPVWLDLHLIRAALAIVMLWGFLWALSRASMADTYAVFMCAPLLVVLAAPGWVSIRTADWLWILAVGLTGWAGQYLITEAFRLAPASLVAPYEYTALVWAVGIDWIVWQALPGLRMIAGAGVVVGAGLYLLHRERQAG